MIYSSSTVDVPPSMRRLLFENFQVPEAETEDGKTLVIVDVDLGVSDIARDPYAADNGKHRGGNTFMEQQFLVDRPLLDRLLSTNKFYVDFSEEECVVDMLSGTRPFAGSTNGVIRKAGAERPDTPAGAYRFVSPQSFTSAKRVFVSAEDGRIIDTAGKVTLMDGHGRPTALRDDATGETLFAGKDFKVAVLCEIFGYWQRFGEDGKAEDVSDKSHVFTQFRPGQRVRTVDAKVATMIGFIEQHRQFNKTPEASERQPVQYRTTYRLKNMLFGAYGKVVGEYASKDETEAAAREDFDRQIAAGSVVSPKLKPFSSADLVFRERYDDLVMPGREFQYVPWLERGKSHKTKTQLRNTAVYEITKIDKRVQAENA